MTAGEALVPAMALGDAVWRQANLVGAPLSRDVLQEIPDSLESLEPLIHDAGLDTIVTQRRALRDVPVPAIMALKSGDHVVLVGLEGDTASLADPNLEGQVIQVPAEALAEQRSETVIALRKSEYRLAHDQGLDPDGGHWFWSYVRKQRTALTLILVSSLIANMLAAATSLFALQVYDRVIPNQSEDTLWVLLIGVAVAFLFEAALRIARSQVIDRTGRKVDLTVSAALLRRLMALRLGPKAPRASRLTQLLREFGTVREFVTEAAVGALADIPFSILFFGLIYWIAGPVVLVPMVAMVLMIIPPVAFRRRMLRIAEEALGAHTASGRLFNEVTYNLDTLKLGRAEQFFDRQWAEISELICNSSTRQRDLSAKLTQWSMSMQQASHALTVTACVYLVFAGEMTVGAIIATTILTGRALSPMTRLSTVLMRWHLVRTSLEALNAVVDGESERPPDRAGLRVTSRPMGLAVREMSFRYVEDGEEVVSVPGLKISPGERIALLGPNGSGKSTLLRLLCGLYVPEQGAVTLDDLDLRQIEPGDLRRAVSYMPQDVMLFKGTLRDNVAFGRADISDDQVRAALDTAGLRGLLSDRPEGLEFRLDDGGAGLSVGQRQSVGLARMIAHDPGVVLLDEPTASLDQTAEAEVIRRLGSWVRHRSLIIATHRTPVLSLVNRIIVLGRGHIVVDGPRDAVLERLRKAQEQVRDNESAEQRPRQPAPQDG